MKYLYAPDFDQKAGVTAESNKDKYVIVDSGSAAEQQYVNQGYSAVAGEKTQAENLLMSKGPSTTAMMAAAQSSSPDAGTLATNQSMAEQAAAAEEQARKDALAQAAAKVDERRNQEITQIAKSIVETPAPGVHLELDQAKQGPVTETPIVGAQKDEMSARTAVPTDAFRAEKTTELEKAGEPKDPVPAETPPPADKVETTTAGKAAEPAKTESPAKK